MILRFPQKSYKLSLFMSLEPRRYLPFQTQDIYHQFFFLYKFIDNKIHLELVCPSIHIFTLKDRYLYFFHLVFPRRMFKSSPTTQGLFPLCPSQGKPHTDLKSGLPTSQQLEFDSRPWPSTLPTETLCLANDKPIMVPILSRLLDPPSCQGLSSHLGPPLTMTQQPVNGCAN